MTQSELLQIQFTPEDAQRIWDITPGMFNSYRSRHQLPATVQKTGRLHITRFNVRQLCHLGIQLDLVKNLGVSQNFAKEVAAEAADEIWKELLRPDGTPLPRLLFAIVLDPPKWFRVKLDDSVATVDSLAGGEKWVLYDAAIIVASVSDYMIDQAGRRPEFEKWAKRLKARKN